MKQIAFIFPGQGAQYVGMGKDFYDQEPLAREVFQEADDTLGIPLTRFCHEGPESSLMQTEITQPAILTTSVAMLRVLKSKGFNSTMTAGLSLGEYTALVHAETIPFGEALKLVQKRGKYMQEAVPADRGGMAAILGLDPEHIEKCLSVGRRVGFVSVANYNCPGQLVISGSITGVDKACDLLTQKGAKRALKLPVGGAFHSPLMEPAREELAAAIKSTVFSTPVCPVYQNVNAQPVTNPAEIQQNLIDQLTAPVRWTQTVKNMIAGGATSFTEIGPGKVLQGLVKKVDRTMETFGMDQFEL